MRAKFPSLFKSEEGRWPLSYSRPSFLFYPNFISLCVCVCAIIRVLMRRHLHTSLSRNKSSISYAEIDLSTPLAVVFKIKEVIGGIHNERQSLLLRLEAMAH